MVKTKLALTRWSWCR